MGGTDLDQTQIWTKLRSGLQIDMYLIAALGMEMIFKLKRLSFFHLTSFSPDLCGDHMCLPSTESCSCMCLFRSKHHGVQEGREGTPPPLSQLITDQRLVPMNSV